MTGTLPVYAALSVASKVSAAVRAQGTIFSMTREVWKLDFALRDFLGDIYRAAENPPSAPIEPITEEATLEAANSLLRLHRTIDGLYLRAKRSGLTNRRFIGMALNSVKTRAEELLDLGDAIQLALDTNVDVLLSRSIEDLHKGNNMHDLPTFK
jgi:hypothetical protein